MKKLKALLNEKYSFQREFGEPLPTLQNTIDAKSNGLTEAFGIDVIKHIEQQVSHLQSTVRTAKKAVMNNQPVSTKLKGQIINLANGIVREITSI